MTNWLFSIDPEKYNIYEALADTGAITVGCQDETIETGDTVYIHVNGKDSRIAFRCEVTDRNIYTTTEADRYGGLAEGVTFEGADLVCRDELPQITFSKAELASGGIRVKGHSTLTALEEKAMAFLEAAFEQAVNGESETEETEEEARPAAGTARTASGSAKTDEPAHPHTADGAKLAYHGLSAEGIGEKAGKGPFGAHRKMQGRPLSERKLRRIMRRA